MGMTSVWEQWLLQGSGSRRKEVSSIPAVHLDSLGAVITGVRFVVQCWCHGRNWNKTILYSLTSI